MLQIGRRRRPFTYSQLRSIDKRSKQTRWTQLLLLFSALSIYSRLFGLFPFISAREIFFDFLWASSLFMSSGGIRWSLRSESLELKKKYRTKLGSAARKKKTYQASPTGELSGSATTQRIRPKKKTKGNSKVESLSAGKYWNYTKRQSKMDIEQCTVVHSLLPPFITKTKQEEAMSSNFCCNLWSIPKRNETETENGSETLKII